MLLSGIALVANSRWLKSLAFVSRSLELSACGQYPSERLSRSSKNNENVTRINVIKGSNPQKEAARWLGTDAAKGPGRLLIEPPLGCRPELASVLESRDRRSGCCIPAFSDHHPSALARRREAPDSQCLAGQVQSAWHQLSVRELPAQ